MILLIAKKFASCLSFWSSKKSKWNYIMAHFKKGRVHNWRQRRLEFLRKTFYVNILSKIGKFYWFSKCFDYMNRDELSYKQTKTQILEFFHFISLIHCSCWNVFKMKIILNDYVLFNLLMCIWKIVKTKEEQLYATVL